MEAPELQHTVAPNYKNWGPGAITAARSLCHWLVKRGAPHARHLVGIAPPDNLRELDFSPLMASALAACTGLTQLKVASDWPGLGGVSWQQGMTRLRKLGIWTGEAADEGLEPYPTSLTALAALEELELDYVPLTAALAVQLPASLTSLELMYDRYARPKPMPPLGAINALPPQVRQGAAAAVCRLHAS